MSNSFAPEVAIVLTTAGGEQEKELKVPSTGQLRRWNFSSTGAFQIIEIFDRPGQALGDQIGLLAKIQPTANDDAAVFPDPIDYENHSELGGVTHSENKVFLVTADTSNQTITLQIGGRT